MSGLVIGIVSFALGVLVGVAGMACFKVSKDDKN